MDALADAADGAAAAAVEEELLLQQERMHERAALKSFFSDKGFARTNDGGEIKLLQSRTDCCALHCCKLKDVPLSSLLRCDLCGYCSHSSCQKNLSPPVPELVKNRVCNVCIEALGLPTSSDNIRCVSINEKAMKFVDLELRNCPLELLSKKATIALKAQFDDGFYDEIEEEEDDDDDDNGFDDDSTKYNGMKDNDDQGELCKVLRF
jgi:hypothetical protein